MLESVLFITQPFVQFCLIRCSPIPTKRTALIARNSCAINGMGIQEPSYQTVGISLVQKSGRPDGFLTQRGPKRSRKWLAPCWPEIRKQFLDSAYRPAPARRKSIPKADGSERQLGIPNVLDRLIQQALLQILTPIFDPKFPNQVSVFDQNDPHMGRSSRFTVRFAKVTATTSIWTSRNSSIADNTTS